MKYTEQEVVNDVSDFVMDSFDLSNSWGYARTVATNHIEKYYPLIPHSKRLRIIDRAIIQARVFWGNIAARKTAMACKII